MAKSEGADWLDWAREIQALSQIGLTYSSSEFDTQRYQRLAEIAAEIVQAHTGLEKQPLLRDFLAQSGYATPKVDVRGAVVRDGKVLLVQERADECWCLPGGWADVGEFPTEMVVREVWEESGFEVAPRKVIGIYDANRANPLEFYHAYKLVMLCEIIGGAPRPSNETMAVDFFSFDALPRLSTARTNERHLADVLAHCRDPQCPTNFD